MNFVRTPEKKKLGAFGVDEPNSIEAAKGPKKGLKEGVCQE